MPRNLEIKIPVDSFKDLKMILASNRIKLVKVINQRDVYYSIKEGLLKLRIEDDEESLIYYKRDELSQKRWSDYKLVKFRQGDIENFFSEFLPVDVVVSKTRELYLFDDTRIHLDKVSGLGLFIELETQVIKGLKDAEKRFNTMIRLLQLVPAKQLRSSYRDLLFKKKNDSD